MRAIETHDDNECLGFFHQLPLRLIRDLSPHWSWTWLFCNFCPSLSQAWTVHRDAAEASSKPVRPNSAEPPANATAGAHAAGRDPRPLLLALSQDGREVHRVRQHPPRPTLPQPRRQPRHAHAGEVRGVRAARGGDSARNSETCSQAAQGHQDRPSCWASKAPNVWVRRSPGPHERNATGQCVWRQC